MARHQLIEGENPYPDLLSSIDCNGAFGIHFEKFERKLNRMDKRKCDRCKFTEEANSIQVEIRCYRDILYQSVNPPSPQPLHEMHEWLSTRPHASKLDKLFTAQLEHPNYECTMEETRCE